MIRLCRFSRRILSQKADRLLFRSIRAFGNEENRQSEEEDDSYIIEPFDMEEQRLEVEKD
jgi:hypothetical protein